MKRKMKAWFVGLMSRCFGEEGWISQCFVVEDFGSSRYGEKKRGASAVEGQGDPGRESLSGIVTGGILHLSAGSAS